MLAPNQSVSANVAFANPFSMPINFTPQVFVVQAATATACDVSPSGTGIADVQLMIDEALGTATAANDLNSDGSVDVVDVQTVLNAALGLGCSSS